MVCMGGEPHMEQGDGQELENNYEKDYCLEPYWEGYIQSGYSQHSARQGGACRRCCKEAQMKMQ